MPEDNLKCIESWKKFLPDYKLMLWNEDNYDVNSIKFTRQAYQKKKYAFVIDPVRLQLLREHGGIWLDTDIEIIKNLDPLLELPAFMSFESDTLLHTGIVGSEKGAAWTDEYWKYMNRKPFIRWNGRLNKTPSTVIISRILKKRGVKLDNTFQIYDDSLHIFPKDYFCPKDYKTGKITITDNTYCIHHFAGSWK
jgi:mannosyltransferase OCH1-like enzyme